MKKRNVSVAACLMLCAGLLSGCGGEYAGLTERDAVSGSAVSASAVSGKAVSGQAVKDGKATWDETGKDMSRHRFCTDTNLYYANINKNELRIMQIRLDGTHLKCIRKWQEAEGIALLYVDTDWLYYDVGFDDCEITYRAPVGKDERGYDVVRFSEEEELVREEFKNPLYADADYYFYIDFDGFDPDKLIKYDLKKKEKIWQQKVNATSVEIFRVKDQYFYAYDKGLYVQKTDSGQWEKISDVMEDENDNEVLPAANGREIFYPWYTVGEKSRLRFEIRSYDGEQEREFVKWEQLSRAVEEVAGTEKLDVCMPDQLFCQGDRFYIQLQAGWMEGDTCHMEYMMFSRGEDGSAFRYEKDLTECMKSHVRRRSGKWADDYEKDEIVYVEHMAVNDARCIAMVDGKAYLSLYDYEKDTGRLGCYDLANRTFEWVSREDKAFYRLGYDTELFMFEDVFDSILSPDGISELPDEWNGYANAWRWPPSKDKEHEGYFVEE